MENYLEAKILSLGNITAFIPTYSSGTWYSISLFGQFYLSEYTLKEMIVFSTDEKKAKYYTISWPKHFTLKENLVKMPVLERRPGNKLT